MRKLFWSCTTCGILLVGGVVSTAHFAVHHPASPVGRVLTGASYAAAFFNPVSGIGPAVAQARAACAGPEEAVTEQGVPDEPAPAPDEGQAGAAVGSLPPLAGGDELKSNPQEPGPIVVANSGSAPIVIREDDPPAPASGQVSAATHTGPFCPGAECPSALAAAPAMMPYCEEDDDCEVLPMPRGEPEVLPMPHEETTGSLLFGEGVNVLPGIDAEDLTGCMGKCKEAMIDCIKRCNEEQIRDKNAANPVAKPTSPNTENHEDCLHHSPCTGCPSKDKCARPVRARSRPGPSRRPPRKCQARSVPRPCRRSTFC